ncbi:hypothetical protein KA089_01600 [Candidatus Woesebacteria bacterium]|nr:hypothetical protein [Candidatus Woesebacteria bacterium]
MLVVAVFVSFNLIKVNQVAGWQNMLGGTAFALTSWAIVVALFKTFPELLSFVQEVLGERLRFALFVFIYALSSFITMYVMQAIVIHIVVQFFLFLAGGGVIYYVLLPEKKESEDEKPA